MKLQTSQNKRVRGEILRLLYSVYPGTVEVQTIINALLDSGYITTPEIGAHIDYLMGEEKKYILPVNPDVVAEVLKGLVKNTAFVKLSPRGLDLVEGTIEDPGVDV